MASVYCIHQCANRNLILQIHTFLDVGEGLFACNKNIKTNIFRKQAYDSIMCGYFCIGFIDFIVEGKTLTEFTNIFSPNNFKRKDDIILNYSYG